MSPTGIPARKSSPANRACPRVSVGAAAPAVTTVYSISNMVALHAHDIRNALVAVVVVLTKAQDAVNAVVPVLSFV